MKKSLTKLKGLFWNWCRFVRCDISMSMLGYYHKMKGRCERCGRMVNSLYYVREPIQGRFCTAMCAKDASRQMEEGLTDQELNKAKEFYGSAQDLPTDEV